MALEQKFTPFSQSLINQGANQTNPGGNIVLGEWGVYDPGGPGGSGDEGGTGGTGGSEGFEQPPGLILPGFGATIGSEGLAAGPGGGTGGGSMDEGIPGGPGSGLEWGGVNPGAAESIAQIQEQQALEEQMAQQGIYFNEDGTWSIGEEGWDHMDDALEHLHGDDWEDMLFDVDAGLFGSFDSAEDALAYMQHLHSLEQLEDEGWFDPFYGAENPGLGDPIEGSEFDLGGGFNFGFGEGGFGTGSDFDFGMGWTPENNPWQNYEYAQQGIVGAEGGGFTIEDFEQFADIYSGSFMSEDAQQEWGGQAPIFDTQEQALEMLQYLQNLQTLGGEGFFDPSAPVLDPNQDLGLGFDFGSGFGVGGFDFDLPLAWDPNIDLSPYEQSFIDAQQQAPTFAGGGGQGGQAAKRLYYPGTSGGFASVGSGIGGDDAFQKLLKGLG